MRYNTRGPQGPEAETLREGRTSSKQAISGDPPFAEVATLLFDRVCGAKGSNTKVT